MTTERTHLSIGEVLSLLQPEFPDITISKIRFLESQGLIEPERTPSGYRKFYDHDVELLRMILREQRENFLPLRVIKDRIDSGQLDPTPPRGDQRKRSPADDEELAFGERRDRVIGARVQELPVGRADLARERVVDLHRREVVAVPRAGAAHDEHAAVPDRGDRGQHAALEERALRPPGVARSGTERYR